MRKGKSNEVRSVWSRRRTSYREEASSQVREERVQDGKASRCPCKKKKRRKDQVDPIFCASGVRGCLLFVFFSGSNLHLASALTTRRPWKWSTLATLSDAFQISSMIANPSVSGASRTCASRIRMGSQVLPEWEEGWNTNNMS